MARSSLEDLQNKCMRSHPRNRAHLPASRGVVTSAPVYLPTSIVTCSCAQTSRIQLSVIGPGFALKTIKTCEKPTCKDVVICSEKLDMYYMCPNVYYMYPDMCTTLVPVCIACRDTYDTYPGTYNPYQNYSIQQAGRNKHIETNSTLSFACECGHVRAMKSIVTHNLDFAILHAQSDVEPAFEAPSSSMPHKMIKGDGIFTKLLGEDGPRDGNTRQVAPDHDI